MLDAPMTVAPLLLAAVLCLSGTAKLLRHEDAESAFVSLRLPAWLVRMRAPLALPFVELALALALLATSGPVAVLVASCCLALFVAYLVVIVRALTFGETVECSCFGALGLGTVDRFTAVRNMLLAGLAALVLLDATGGDSVISRMLRYSAADCAWLAGVGAGIVLTWLVAGHRGTEPTPASAGSLPDDADDYQRTPIPFARLTRADGTKTTLRELAATGPVLLLIVSPTCGSCVRVIAKARWWQHQVPVLRTILVFAIPASADVDGVHDSHDFDILFDPAGELHQLFGVGNPAGVLLGADGLLAGGPVCEAPTVLEWMDDIHAHLSEVHPPS